MEVLSEQQIQEKLGAIRGWTLIDGQIKKTFSFESFAKAMEYINKLAMVMENQDHYPDIHIRYSKVTIATRTRDADGITDKDFIFAKACDQLAVDMV